MSLDYANTVLAAIAIIVPIWIYRNQRREKCLACSVRSNLLLSVQDSIKEKIRIFYDDKQVVDVHFMEFDFLCCGNIPISPDDFISPLEIFLGEHGHILTAEVVSSTPSDLGACIRWHSSEYPLTDLNRICISPLLLNPRDTLKISCLVTGSDKCDIRGRINGVRQIKNGEKLEMQEKLAYSLYGFFLILIFATGMIVSIIQIVGINNRFISAVWGIMHSSEGLSGIFKTVIEFVLVLATLFIIAAVSLSVRHIARMRD